MIWSLCLNNAHVRIYGSVRGHKNRSLKVERHNCTLNEQSEFVFEISSCGHYPRVDGNYTPILTRGRTVFSHGVS